MTAANSRTTDHPIDKLFLERWSPRAFTGEAIPEAEFLTILEAANWAPSSYNSQPWRFVYARRETPHWDKLLSLLIEFNQSWAKNAAALIFIVSNELFPGRDKPTPSRSHAFDTGAAWGSLALQATLLNWYAHGMVGLDWDKVNAALNVPEHHHVQAAIAIGRLAPADILPEALRAREVPSPRNPLSAHIF